MEVLGGLLNAIEPGNLLFVVLGVTVGISFGAVPGLDATTGTALLIPLTYGLSATQALLFLSSLYVGGVFGGSITAILFRIPGASEAVMTTLDGYPMAQKGKAGKALGTAIMSSSIGGTFATIVAVIMTAQLTKVALSFGPAEYAALALLGLSCITSLGGTSQLKGIVSACVGLLAATIGADAIAGVPRFAFGSEVLYNGIPFVPAVIGLFAASEVFSNLSKSQELKAEQTTDTKKFKTELMTIKDFLRMKWIILRGSIIGTWIGILPGVGATTAAIIGYSTEVRLSKHPEKFGTGIPEGIAAAESSNNSAAVGAMIPLLSLGIPGSATTAVLIGAFLIHGLKVGPLLMVNNSELVYTIFGGMFFSNFLIILGGALAVKFFVKLIKIPYTVMSTSIISFCIVGALSLGDYHGVIVMFIFAIIGFFLNKYGYPSAPVVLGLVLGPILEDSMRRALMISNNNIGKIITRPITASILIIAVISLLTPYFGNIKSFFNRNTKNATN